MTRRDLVQVTGTVVVDADDLPIRIQDVESIQALDMTDFEVRTVEFSGKRLRFKRPLALTPYLSDTKQYLVLQHDELDIDVMAPTREELLEELHEQIYMLWVEYAQAPDEKLTPRAAELKARLRKAVREA